MTSAPAELDKLSYEEAVEQVRSQCEECANTAKALLVAQTEAGNRSFVHLARIYTFERLATRLAEIARDKDELRDYQTRFAELRSKT